MPSLSDVTLGLGHCVTYGEDIDLTRESELRKRTPPPWPCAPTTRHNVTPY